MMHSPQTPHSSPTPPVRSVSPLVRYQFAERCPLPHDEVQPLPGFQDIRIVLGSAVCGWLFLALATFNAADASFFNTLFPAVAATNWCGTLGAQCAAWLFVLVGPAAWVCVAMVSYSLFARGQIKVLPAIIQTSAGTIIVSACAMLSSLFGVGIAGGGIVGNTLLSWAAGIGQAGAALTALVALFFAALVFVRCPLRRFLYGVKVVAAYAAYSCALFWHLLKTGVLFLWSRNGDNGAEGAAPLPFHLPRERREVVREQQEDENVFTLPEIEEAPAAPSCPLNKKPMGHEDPVDVLDVAEAAPQRAAQDEEPRLEHFLPATEPEEVFAVPAEEEEESSEMVQATEGQGEETGVAEEEAEDEGGEEDDDEGGDGGVSALSSYQEGDSRDSVSQESESPTALGIWEEEEVSGPAVYTEPASFSLPPLEKIFDSGKPSARDEAFLARCQERAQILEEKLMHFGVSGRVLGIRPGPIVTLFEYEPDVGNKVSRILALEDDLALSLKALSIRILAPIPGQSVVGFEIANEKREAVMFGDLLGEDGLAGTRAHLPLALGVDIVGKPVIADLATMPHLLVAGATGSGKSVGMNVMLVSLLARVSPDKVRVVLIDPKRLEFTPYADIPHLLFPIVTNPSDVPPVLKWVAEEMELRYELMAQLGVRNIAEYHKLNPATCFAKEREIGIHVHGMPYMVIMIDELADLIMTGGREIEMLIARIAQMARAAGIHMLVATQRPSVDVVTGLIKANFPSRIAFRVSSKIDSRTIIDTSGAEKLLGRGDMLYMSPSNMGGVQRLHGAYVTDAEIDRLTDYLKGQRPASYFSLKQVVAQHTEAEGDSDDPLYDEVREFIDSIDEISISLLQRKYRVGFNRSARLIEMLERDGHVAAAQGGKPRRVLRD